jgi:hypothetical protein
MVSGRKREKNRILHSASMSGIRPRTGDRSMKNRVNEIRRRGLGVIAALAIASPAIAEIDLENLESRVGKSAADAAVVFEKPKGTCVCLHHTTPGIAGKAGILRRSRVTVSGITRVRVDCRVVGFDSSGALAVQIDCDDFAPLPK